MFFLLSKRSCCLAVGEIEREFDAPTPCIEIAITIAIWCAFEALGNEVTDIRILVDIALLFELAEVLSIHDDKSWLSVLLIRCYDIVAVTVFCVGIVSHLYSLAIAEVVCELFEWVVHKT